MIIIGYNLLVRSNIFDATREVGGASNGENGRGRVEMYNYQVEKAAIFTEKGQREFLKIRDQVYHLLTVAGAVRAQEATAGVCGDSWTHLACVDRLVELGEIRELTGPNCCWQYRVFVKARDGK